MELSKVLLDASAYIAYISQEPGCDVVSEIIGKSCINTVTYTEIISFYTKKGLSDDLLKELCQYVEIINVNENICYAAGHMIKTSRDYGLSLGDRLCLATAQYFNLTVYTADKIWLRVADELKINIVTIR